MAKRRRGARDGHGLLGAMDQEQRPHPEQEQRLYLIFDDDPLGYSIREISLSPPSSRRSSRKNTGDVRPLPHPIICLEAERGLPSSFAAIGTRIVMTQCLNPLGAADYIMPMYDVRHRVVTFGPGKLVHHMPIYLPMGTELFALDSCSFWKLSFNPQWPPPPDYLRRSDDVPWSWQKLPLQTFDRGDVTSYAVLPDGQTILFSTDYWPEDPYSTPQSTFAFDTRTSLWGKCGEWMLPFTGRAYFVRRLQAFVGLSKDPDHLGHLASCKLDDHCPAAIKLGKEKLFSEDLAETHVSAKLVYTGSGVCGGSEFCLVECVSVKDGNGNAADEENLEEEPRPSCCYRYRLTSFSLSYDYNGDLTTGKTSQVQCYDVPRETTKSFIDFGDPLAFWL